MKATYKRTLAAAVSMVGLISLGAAQTKLDATDAPRIMINQVEVNFTNAQPGTINGQLMVPVREVAEQLGGNVQWRSQEKEVVINLPNMQMVTLDTNLDWLRALISDETVFRGPSVEPRMLAANEVVLIGDRAYIPFDQLSTTIKGTGDWDRRGGTASITVGDGNSDQNSIGDDKQAPAPPSNPIYNVKSTGGVGTPFEKEAPSESGN